MEDIIFKHVASYGTASKNLDSLNEVQIKQLVKCSELYGEIKVTEENIEDFFYDEIDADLYHVIDTETLQVVFDFWNYMADSGTLFVHNSPQYAGYEMIQFSIDHIETNAYNKHLPQNFDEILNEAFDRAVK